MSTEADTPVQIVNHEFTVNFNLILATDPTGTIGNNNDLPWGKGELTGDLKRFRQLTDGKIVIMGANTFRSLPTYPKGLPGRLNIVVESGYNLALELENLSKVGKLLHDINDDLESSNYAPDSNVIVFRNEWISLDTLGELQGRLSIHEDKIVKALLQEIYRWSIDNPNNTIVKSNAVDGKVIVAPLDIMVIGGSKLYDSFIHVVEFGSRLLSGYLEVDNKTKRPFTAMVNKLKTIHLTVTNKLYKGNTKSYLAQLLLKELTSTKTNNWTIDTETHEAMQTHVNFDITVKRNN